MHILFLGNSRLVNRRILPILPALPQITRVSVARFGTTPWQETSCPVDDRYDSFDAALSKCTPNLVYVSTVNSAHFEHAVQWLERGCHVIVDKPATLRLQDTQALIALARKQGVLVAEATVYTHHPQIAQVKALFEAHPPRQATVQFAFPPLEPANFRYQAALGGGALFDTAAYAASVGRVFFGTLPSSVVAVCSERNPDGLCLAYSTLMQYPGGQTMAGHFGFQSEYINRLHLLGERMAVQVDRVFTTPGDLANAIQVQANNEQRIVHSQPANAFTCFLAEVFRALQGRTYDAFADAMLYDATVTEQMQVCLKEGIRQCP